jgi:hypothetical protein
MIINVDGKEHASPHRSRFGSPPEGERHVPSRLLNEVAETDIDFPVVRAGNFK